MAGSVMSSVTNQMTPGRTGGVSSLAIKPTQAMPYTVRALDLQKDRENVLRVWGATTPAIPETKYAWMYENNPYGCATGWLLFDNKQDVAGLVTLFPRGMLAEGKLRLAGIAGDFIIKKQHRSLGPALLLQKTIVAERKRHGFDFVYGLPNEQAGLVLERAGYKLVGQAVRLAKPIRSYNYLQRSISSELLAGALAGPLDWAMRWTSKESRHKRQRTLDFETLENFDERFNSLWSRIALKRNIVGERTAAYLNWRYAGSPYKTYHLYAVTERKSRAILGYVIAYSVGTSTHIADLCVVDQPGVMDFLLSEFLHVQRRQKVDSVSLLYFGQESFIRKLREYGFAVRGPGRNIFVLTDGDYPQLLNQRNWHLFDGDADS